MVGRRDELGRLAYSAFFSDDQRIFLPGETTHGHYQIELRCDACHTPDGQVDEQTCLDCHGEYLKKIEDSHPAKKFRDPRNADRLEKINAMSCVECHREHAPAMTHGMGLTVPQDFCFQCHADIGDERESHKDLPFGGCSDSGCHNYHDNTALYENFLVKHINDLDHKHADSATVPMRNFAARWHAQNGPNQTIDRS